MSSMICAETTCTTTVTAVACWGVSFLLYIGSYVLVAGGVPLNEFLVVRVAR